ncbi:PP2C-like phosphatase [Cryptosporidium ryanae]|uniref:PP2C-like phosphatase n=1 Tax=Cryptosporidium ryanae TaxID=515981 RepID=UPI003519FB14|nr:PP2C-like phosphatase [Cryptosporidium ryanae]
MPYFVNLKECIRFEEAISSFLKGENTRFFLESNVCEHIILEKGHYLEFVNHYFINKKRILKHLSTRNIFKIPLLVDKIGKIIKIGWSVDWNRNTFKTGNSEYVELLKQNYKFIYLYVVYGVNKNGDAPPRMTAGNKLQSEERDPLSIDLNYGCFESQGTRSYMEDRTFVSLDVLNSDPNSINCSKQRITFIAIYDGHNGEFSVEFLKSHLHLNFSASFENGRANDYVLNTANALLDAFDITEKQLKQEYLKSTYSVSINESDSLLRETDKINEDLDSRYENCLIKNFSSGSTAIVCCIIFSTLCIGNLGDSRAIICRGGRAQLLTKDHRLKSNLEERERVKEEGGTFDDEGYLSGNLSVSRAFGNWDRSNGAKLTGLSSIPEIYFHTITREDEFLIIACDGIFESVTNQEAVSIVRRSLIEFNNPNIAAEKLVNIALQRQSLDNLSVVVLILTSPNSTTCDANQTNNPAKTNCNKQLDYQKNSIQQNQVPRRVYNFSNLKNLLT